MIVIDGGAHDGSSCCILRDRFSCQVEAYEPYPIHIPKYEYLEDVTLHREALWTRDGMIKFYPGGDDFMGSSILKEKKNIDAKHSIEVPCVDTSRLIDTLYGRDQSIVLKLDIEGAEYPILDQLIKDGTIAKVSLLLVEYHWKKIGMPEAEHRKLVDRLNKTNIQWELWE